MTANELKAEIDRRRILVAPMLREIEALERQLDDAESREFIAEHKITAAQVQSSREGEWFGTVMSFGEWLAKSNCQKPWAEWNGRLYPTAELKVGSMRRSAPGLADHVPI